MKILILLILVLGTIGGQKIKDRKGKRLKKGGDAVYKAPSLAELVAMGFNPKMNFEDEVAEFDDSETEKKKGNRSGKDEEQEDE